MACLDPKEGLFPPGPSSGGMQLSLVTGMIRSVAADVCRSWGPTINNGYKSDDRETD